MKIVVPPKMAVVRNKNSCIVTLGCVVLLAPVVTFVGCVIVTGWHDGQQSPGTVVTMKFPTHLGGGHCLGQCVPVVGESIGESVVL